MQIQPEIFHTDRLREGLGRDGYFVEERVLELKDGAVVYQIGGQGPLVVLSHALDLVAWGSVERLQLSCTVVIPEWERSSIPIEARMAFSWFEALVPELGFQSATLCVWSMAGPAAIYYATDARPHLSHLILVDVAGLGDGFPPLRLRDLPHLVLTRLLGRPTRGFVRIMWRNWVRQKSVDTKPLEEAMVRFLRSEAAAWSPRDDEDDPSESLHDQLPDIKVPTLVLAGRHSSVLGPQPARAVTELIPGAELIVFEESSHALQLEEPIKFQDSVAAFVTK